MATREADIDAMMREGGATEEEIRRSKLPINQAYSTQSKSNVFDWKSLNNKREEVKPMRHFSKDRDRDR